MKFDRRLIYLLVLLALCVPLLLKWSVKPARMKAADKTFELIESLNPAPGQVVFVSMDFGPSTIAENGSQAQVVLEHLMRRRIPFVTASLTTDSAPLMQSIPSEIAERLAQEFPGQEWKYGRDWVNLGYLAGTIITVQSIPKAENLAAFFKKDVRGNSLQDLPLFQKVTDIKSFPVIFEATGSPGTLEAYLQFFQRDDYKPKILHGCTSIMTPGVFIYLDSNQLAGALEGIGGAAWYAERLNQTYPGRAVDNVTVINTGLGVAHVVIILLIIAGNIAGYLAYRRGGAAR